MKRYQNERLNSEGVSQDACLIINMEEAIIENPEYKYNDIEVKITLKYNDDQLERNSNNEPKLFKNPRREEGRFVFDREVNQ